MNKPEITKEEATALVKIIDIYKKATQGLHVIEEKQKKLQEQTDHILKTLIDTKDDEADLLEALELKYGQEFTPALITECLNSRNED